MVCRADGGRGGGKASGAEGEAPAEAARGAEKGARIEREGGLPAAGEFAGSYEVTAGRSILSSVSVWAIGFLCAHSSCILRELIVHNKFGAVTLHALTTLRFYGQAMLAKEEAAVQDCLARSTQHML